MKCPQCGFENPPGFAFCGQCGTRFATSAAPALISEADLARLRRYLTPAQIEALLPAAAWREQDVHAMHEHLSRLFISVVPYLPRHLVRAELAQRKEPQQLAGGEFLNGTLMFSDVSGFTALSERLSVLGREGAEQITDIINRYFGQMMSIVFAHGGDVFKFGGDALLVYFPDGPQPGSLAALQASWHMQQAMADFAEVKTSLGVFPLRMKIALNAGSIFAARVGTATTRQFIVTGKEVNATARAESLAVADQVLCTPNVYHQVAAYVPLDRFVPGPEDHYLLTSLVPRLPDPFLSGPFPMVSALPDLLTALDRLAPYLSPGLLPKMIDSPGTQTASGEHRLIGVLFANFLGATELIERSGHADPIGLAEQLNQYFIQMQSAIARYDGVINKIDLYDHGDKILALFGAPIAHEDDAERTVRAALDMQATEKDAGAMFISQSIGVNTGVVFAGDMGSNERREYTVMGDDVNLAARLMSAAPQNELLLSETIQRKVSAFFELANRGTVKVKGKAHPVPIFSIVGRRAQPEPVRGIRGLSSPLVGRERETHIMREIALDLQNGRGGIVSIIGEAGLGKSRLVNELHAEQVDFNWLEGHCLSYTQNVSYSAFIEVMRGALSLFESDSDAERWAKLRHAIDELLPGDLGDDVLPYLAHFLNLPLEGNLAERVAYLEGEALQRQVIRAVAVFVEKLAQQKPLVLMFDDLHWADSASLTLLERLLALPDRAPLLIGLLYRPDRSHGCWALGQTAARNYPHRYTEITLKPLDVTTGEDLQMVRHLLSIAAVPETLAQIIARAEGNPFYIEEIIRALIDAQAIVQRDQQWHISEALNLEAVPDSLQGIIMARIDRLLDEARRALQVASVVGRSFRYQVLHWLATAAALAHLDIDLADLQRAELVREQTRVPELEYGFAQAMFREVAYESLLVRDRRTYHRLVGQQLEEVYSAQREDVYELLAHHYSLSDDQAKALQYLIKAGDKTRSAYANKEALNFYRQAEALADELGSDDDKAAIAEGLGDVAYHIGEYDEALLRFTQALRFRHDPRRLADLHRRNGAVYEKRGEYVQALTSVMLGMSLLTPDQVQTVELARLLSLQCRVHRQQSQFEEAIEAGEKALAIVEDSTYYRDSAQAHNELGQTYEWSSQPENAIQQYQQGLRTLERIGDDYGAAKIYNNLAISYYQTDLDISASYFERSLSAMQRFGDVWGESTAYQNLGIVQYARSNYAEAIQYYERSMAMKERLGDNLGLADCQINLGETYRAKGEPKRAIAYLERGLTLAQQIGAHQAEAECYRQLAECFLEIHEAARALTTGFAALTHAQEIDDRKEAGIIQRVLGRIYLQLHDLPNALLHFEQSLVVLRELNREFDIGLTLSDYANALIEAHHPAQARQSLAEALTIFTQLQLPQEQAKVQQTLDHIKDTGGE
ncbi:MAG TPA: tetratricopeptide repeat protein [Anaerolineae bacterium]|nr:tetratricopeptide repeat protein [Anaerolineae bacterium]